MSCDCFSLLRASWPPNPIESVEVSRGKVEIGHGPTIGVGGGRVKPQIGIRKADCVLRTNCIANRGLIENTDYDQRAWERVSAFWVLDQSAISNAMLVRSTQSSGPKPRFL